MKLRINGEERDYSMPGDATIARLIAYLQLKQDRIAVEHNGTLAPRTGWSQAELHDGDKLEIVHFVGGGCSAG